MIIYVDIDETICKHGNSDPNVLRDYTKGTPTIENINKINELYKEGHTIIYWTARGSTTGINWFDVTKKQLDAWGALYHEIKMNKPHYDLFICDKAMNSNTFFRENNAALQHTYLSKYKERE